MKRQGGTIRAPPPALTRSGSAGLGQVPTLNRLHATLLGWESDRAWWNLGQRLCLRPTEGAGKTHKMEPMEIKDEQSLATWLSDKPADWAQAIALRAALRALPYIGQSSDLWLRSFALLPFGALISSWLQLVDPSIFVRSDENRANARFGGSNFDFDGYKKEPAVVSIADASYHSADAQSRSMHARSDCVKGIIKAAETFRSVSKQRTTLSENSDQATEKFWKSIQSDCRYLTTFADFRRSGPRSLTLHNLWLNYAPKDLKGERKRFAGKLRSIDPNYSVWIDWYERRIRGEGIAFYIPGDENRYEDRKILRHLTLATNEDFWNKGHKHVNAELTRWLEEARARAAPPQPLRSPQSRPEVVGAIEAQASPQAQIVDGKLDAAPNSKFDKPVYSDDLADLPSQLLAITNVILNSLPRNCEPVVKNCFGGFRDELLVRGNRPILNIVKAMAASLIAELYGAPDSAASPDTWTLKDPREWGAGMDSMFASFFKGYHDLIHHFPMDSDREALIAATPIDEVAASGAALTEPINAVAEMIVELGKQGFATDNIVRIIEAHQLYTRDVAQLPSPDKASNVVTPKRRHVLGTLGFYLNSLSVVGSTASIYSLPAGTFAALADKLKDAIDALLSFVR